MVSFNGTFVAVLLICKLCAVRAFQITSWTKRTVCGLVSMAAEAAVPQDKSAALERQYLEVPFLLKDEAKALGALWDPKKKAWFNPDPLNNAQLDRWVLSSKETRRYLSVPFTEKNEAKILGAKWDADKKLWFNPNPTTNASLNKWVMNMEDVVLKGEDRTFGGNLLFVDLIPSSCWFSNVRSSVHASDWDRLRKKVYTRANNRCECCGSSNGGLEAHERWKYDDTKKTQKLMRLIALCHDCHESTHIGLASIQGKEKEATEHLQRMRMFSLDEVKNHIDEAFEVFYERSEHRWELDLSILTSNGIKLAEIPLSTLRR